MDLKTIHHMDELYRVYMVLRRNASDEAIAMSPACTLYSERMMQEYPKLRAEILDALTVNWWPIWKEGHPMREYDPN